MKLTRREAIAAPFLALPSRAAAKRPNVVMFMTDDHGAWANGCYGCDEMYTPNVDKLAKGGARFTRGFACTPVCSPSRMTYMTGRIPSTHGVQDWLVPRDSFGEKTRNWLKPHPTYADVLAENGYTLGMVGKWHMGEDDKPQHGFTYWATVPGGGGVYKDAEYVKNGDRFVYKGYKTDAQGDYAIEFLEKQKKGNPFNLLMPFYAPHTPFDFQPEEDRRHYANASFSCFPQTAMHPWQNKGLSAHHGKRESMLSYSALITGMDRNVGRVISRLEELGLREDTLVVFTADQGWNAGHHGVWGKGNGTWPFNMYEESLRVPLIWNHPGRIPAGMTPNPMVSSYDYLPTILDYLGIKAPADPKRVGRSYAPFLRGENPRWQNRLYFEYSYVRGVRTETAKYVERTKEWPSELFDLEADPGETKNFLDDPKHKRQLETMRQDLAKFFEKVGSPPIEEWGKTTQQDLTKYSAR